MAQKAAIVTGATRGIGFGIAGRLLREGWAVMGTGTGPEEANAGAVTKLMAQGCFLYQRCDISQGPDREALVKRAYREFESVDALVNNAGAAPRQRADMLELTEEGYDFVLGVNLRGTFFLTQAFAREMILQAERRQQAGTCPEGVGIRPDQGGHPDGGGDCPYGGGRPYGGPVIVVISSISAYTASINRAEYCISKAGLTQVTQLFAERLSPWGINVYEIRPGIVETDMTARVREKYDAMISGGLLPLKRWGKPEDVASAVWAVCAGLLPYSTGEVINVDGGFHMRRL